MISCSIDSDRTCGHLGFEGAKALFQIDASKISFSSNQNIAGVLANQRAQASVCKSRIIEIVTYFAFSKLIF